jgi:hypothetical protein
MCAVFTISDGRIIAIDAYMDSAHEKAYAGVLQSGGFPGEVDA